LRCIAIGVEGRSNGSTRDIRRAWMIQGKEKNPLVGWQRGGVVREEERNATEWVVERQTSVVKR